MIRSIRVLGAALGGLVGIVLVTSDNQLFRDVPGAAAIIVAWGVAWATLGIGAAFGPLATWRLRRETKG